MAGGTSGGAAANPRSEGLLAAPLASHTHPSRPPARLRARSRNSRATTATLSPPPQPHFGRCRHPRKRRPIRRPADLHPPPPLVADRHAHSTGPARPRRASAPPFRGPSTPSGAATPQNGRVTHPTHPTAAPPARGSRARTPNPGLQTRLIPPHEGRAASYRPHGPARARTAARRGGVAAGGVAAAPNGYNRPTGRTTRSMPHFFARAGLPHPPATAPARKTRRVQL